MALNLFLGWSMVGWVVALVWALSSPALASTPQASEERWERECPFCAELILIKAKVCKHCGREVPPAKL